MKLLYSCTRPVLYHRVEFSFNTEFQKKPCAVFEIAEVVPVMTNNYEESILKGAKVKSVADLITEQFRVLQSNCRL